MYPKYKLPVEVTIVSPVYMCVRACVCVRVRRAIVRAQTYIYIYMRMRIDAIFSTGKLSFR